MMFPNDIKPQPRPRPVSMDGFSVPKPTPPIATQQPQRSDFYRPEAAPPQMPEPAHEKPKKSFLRALLGKLGLGLAFILLIAAGPLIQLPGVGQILVAIYGVAAIILKIESRTTFIMALIALAVVFIASIRSNVMLAGTFGLYAFLLLAIATASLLRELRSEI